MNHNALVSLLLPTMNLLKHRDSSPVQ